MKLKFTLRDLFWLVLVVAMAIGWWVERAHDRRRLMQADKSLSQWRLKNNCLRKATEDISGKEVADRILKEHERIMDSFYQQHPEVEY